MLGLFPRGVEQLPGALLDVGLAESVSARHAGRVAPPPYDPRRDPATGLLNPTGLRDFAYALADATGDVLDAGDVPIVLGGDCSIVLGNLLALRRRGRHGLLFIDGHADFYQPEAEPNGEAASMDLALATGRGPAVVADLEGRGSLVPDEDVVQFARRDADEAAEAGSQRIEDTAITVIDLDAVRQRGVERAAPGRTRAPPTSRTRWLLDPHRLRRARRRRHAGGGLPIARWAGLGRAPDSDPGCRGDTGAPSGSRSRSSTPSSTATAPSHRHSFAVSLARSPAVTRGDGQIAEIDARQRSSLRASLIRDFAQRQTLT